MVTHLTGALLAALLVSSAVIAPVAGAKPHTTRVSVSSLGAQARGESGQPALSATGRYVAFRSSAPNLVRRDTNLAADVFVHDRRTRRTTRINVSSAGAQATGDGWFPSISASGRLVAFHSSAANLVRGDTNTGPGGCPPNEDPDEAHLPPPCPREQRRSGSDVFVHDRWTRKTRRLSVSSSGEQANDDSTSASISADGRYVAFLSLADNLVPGDTNGGWDVFLHDLALRRTERVSVRSDGGEARGSVDGPTVSAYGRYVAFRSNASGLVDGDTNARGDVFVRDRFEGTTRRVSVSTSGAQANESAGPAQISADGRYVAFVSRSSNLTPDDTNDGVDLFIHDLRRSTTERVPFGGRWWMSSPQLSRDGRYVAFRADRWTDPSYGEIFVHDRRTGRTRRVSGRSHLPNGEGQLNQDPALSADGRFVAFKSSAGNLVRRDTNGFADVFVRGPLR